MNGFKKAVFAAAVVFGGFATSAYAGLIGDSITLTGNLNGSVSSSLTKTITSGTTPEFANIATYLNFNFDQDTLTITVSGTPANGFSSSLGNLVFSGFDTKITGLTMTSNSPKFNNFTSSDFSLNSAANTITFNFSGVSPQNAQASLTFNIATSGGTTGADVPEPATVALLGLGLLGVAAARRKAAKRAGV